MVCEVKKAMDIIELVIVVLSAIMAISISSMDMVTDAWMLGVGLLS